MNKVFKTVWNTSVEGWIVVLETSSSQKKSSKKIKKIVKNAIVTVVISMVAESTLANGIIEGDESIALGVDTAPATAKGDQVIAIGSQAFAKGQGATALGSYAKADGQNSTAVGQLTQAADGSTAIGGHAQASGNNATAIGASAIAHSAKSIAIGDKIEAEGTNAIAIGALAKGNDTIALGGNASAQGAIAVGQGIVSGEKSAAIGFNNTVSNKNTFVLGTGITTNMENSVLLGARSELSKVHDRAVVNKVVYIETQEDGSKIERELNANFAGTYDSKSNQATPGAVSVGSIGEERQIQNVGAGRISASSTDAINGSQLHAVFGEVVKLENKAISFVTLDENGKPKTKEIIILDENGKPVIGDDGQIKKETVPLNTDVRLGDTFNIKGATVDVVDGVSTLTVDTPYWNLATGENSDTTAVGGAVNTVNFVGDQNLKVTHSALQDEDGQPIGTQVNVTLADQIQLTNQGGLYISAKSESNPQSEIRIQQGNISIGGNQIHQVAAGKAATDAVNMSQLQSSGWNIITQNKDATGMVTGVTENVVNGRKEENKSSVQFDGDHNIQVTQTAQEVLDEDGNIVGNQAVLAIALKKDLDLTATGSITVGNTVLSNNGIIIQAPTSSGQAIVIQQSKVSFGGHVLTDVARGKDDSDAVNVSQLKDAIQQVDRDAGWVLTTNAGSAKENTTFIDAKDQVDFSGDRNISVSHTGNQVEIALNDKLDLSEKGVLNIGTTTLDSQGLTVGDILIQKDHVDFSDQKLNHVGAATEDHQAVNLGQLNQQIGTIEQNITYQVENSGWNLTGTDQKGQTVSGKIKPDNTVEFKAGISGNTLVQTQVTDAGAQVMLDLADQIKLTGSQGSLTIGAVQGKDQITIQQGNISVGGNQIHQLDAGTAAKDAINVTQLKDTIHVFGGDASFNEKTGEIISPTYNVNGGTYNNVGDALGALNQADIHLGDRVSNLQQSLNHRIDDVETRMSAGIASAMALEAAPYVPGKYTYSAATAHHNGQSALGVTLRKTADNGRWSLTGGVAKGSEGEPSLRLGVSGVID